MSSSCRICFILRYSIIIINVIWQQPHVFYSCDTQQRFFSAENQPAQMFTNCFHAGDCFCLIQYFYCPLIKLIYFFSLSVSTLSEFLPIHSFCVLVTCRFKKDHIFHLQAINNIISVNFSKINGLLVVRSWHSCPERLWVPQPWRHSRPCWMGPQAAELLGHSPVHS